jgi:hypothetical protein
MGALEEMAMAEMRFNALAHASVVLAGVLAAGCAALDELAVAQTQRLEEGEFYA